MIGFFLVLLFLVHCSSQALQETVSYGEKKPSSAEIKADGQATVVSSEKDNKVTKVDKAPKQAPVTSSIFAKKTLSTMNYDELKKSKEERVKAGDKKTAIKYLERMSHVYKDLNELKGIMLELAQLLYETEDYTKASKMYHEFTLLYPGSDEVEFAMYQSIISSFKQIGDAEHDQSNTVETKELAQTFLDRASFTTYKKEVQEIALKCEERLLESEINIFNFYIKRGNYVAAKSRLSVIKQTYQEKTIPEFQTRIALLDNLYTNATGAIAKEQTTVVALQDTEEKIDAKVTIDGNSKSA